jgi:hypothetical protein
MNSLSDIINNLKITLNNFYDTVTNKTEDDKIREEYLSKYSSLQKKLTQESEKLINSEEFSSLSDIKKQNALFNLRFEDYKIGVKEELLRKANLLENITYNDPYCKEPENNSYLYVGVILIVFAILLLKFI